MMDRASASAWLVTSTMISKMRSDENETQMLMALQKCYTLTTRMAKASYIVIISYPSSPSAPASSIVALCFVRKQHLCQAVVAREPRVMELGMVRHRCRRLMAVDGQQGRLRRSRALEHSPQAQGEPGGQPGPKPLGDGYPEACIKTHAPPPRPESLPIIGKTGCAAWRGQSTVPSLEPKPMAANHRLRNHHRYNRCRLHPVAIVPAPPLPSS